MILTEQDISHIESIIYVIRGQKVMLDFDLAKLYGVETKVLNQAVKRNIDRFPNDFMFTLNQEEINHLRSSNLKYGGARYAPNAFTENGVAMLSSVLNSQQAVHVNISIMRTFTKLRSFLALEAVHERIGNLEKNSSALFKIVFERLDSLDEAPAPSFSPSRRKIGLKK